MTITSNSATKEFRTKIIVCHFHLAMNHLKPQSSKTHKTGPTRHLRHGDQAVKAVAKQGKLEPGQKELKERTRTKHK